VIQGERWGADKAAGYPDTPAVLAVSYLRVSTDDQAREGFSLDAQRTRIRAYCVAKGYKLAREFVDDGYTGRNTTRPRFQELMRAVREGIVLGGRALRVNVVVVAKFDRLNRNLYEFLATLREMQQNKVPFASVDETVDTRGPLGRFFMQIMGAVAELESGVIGERVRHGMRQKALKGGFNGMSAPYGYEVGNGGLTINEKEAAIVRKICKLRCRGKSLTSIAARLNSEGILTKKGKIWTKRQVFRIVHNPLYRGASHWMEIVVPGIYPAIVSWTPRKRGKGRRGS